MLRSPKTLHTRQFWKEKINLTSYIIYVIIYILIVLYQAIKNIHGYRIGKTNLNKKTQNYVTFPVTTWVLHVTCDVTNVTFNVTFKPALGVGKPFRDPVPLTQILHFSPFFEIRTHNTIASEPLQ